jgi:hypothetical protein
MLRLVDDIVVETDQYVLEIPRGIKLEVFFDDKETHCFCILDEVNNIIYVLDEETAEDLFESSIDSAPLKFLIEGDISVSDILSEGAWESINRALGSDVSKENVKKAWRSTKRFVGRHETKKKKYREFKLKRAADIRTGKVKVLRTRGAKEPIIKKEPDVGKRVERSERAKELRVKRKETLKGRAKKAEMKSKIKSKSGFVGGLKQAYKTKGVRGVAGRLGSHLVQMFGKSGKLGAAGKKLIKWGSKI